MRMARVNITVPDGVLEQARAAGLNVSRIAAIALSEELDRLAKIAALDSYLAELETELGPVSDADRHEATAWADALTSSTSAGPDPRKTRQTRSA